MKHLLHILTISLASVSCSCVAGEYGTVDSYSTPETGEVVINGYYLTDQDLQAFHQIYGGFPAMGRYWYDATSGLYGGEGFPPSGFMYAGHDFGPLSADASAGDQPLWMNGRQLTYQEVSYLSALLGIPAQGGRYWFDAQGNLGQEGSPYPLVNLYAAGSARNSGGGSSGDNFWSSLMGAGNSNADNTQGYVSVPGYGPVGYGF